MKRILKLLRWIPAVLIVGVSWHLSSQEKIERMPQFWNADKLVHLVCFSGLSFWVAFGCFGLNRAEPKSRILIPALLTSLYGIIDEIHQSFVAGRSCSLFDWIFDTLGGVLGAWAFLLAGKCLAAARGR